MKKFFLRAGQKLTDAGTPGGVTAWYAAFLLTVFLLFIPSEGYQNIVLPKHLLFLLSLGGYLLALAAALLVQRKPRPALQQYAPAFRALRLPLSLAGGLLAWYFLSAALSPEQSIVWLGARRYEGFLTLAAYLLLFALSALLFQPRPIHAYGAAVTSVLNFVLILLQFLGLNPLELYPNDLTFHHRGLRYSGEYMGTIGNSGLLAAMLTILCLYLLGSYAVCQKRERFIFLAGGLLAWGGIALSEVAAGHVAVLGCLAVALPICVYHGVGLRRMGEIFGGLCLVLLGKSMVDYDFSNESLTLSLAVHPLSLVLLVLTLCAVPLSIFLRRLPQEKPFPKAAKVIVILYILLALAVFFGLFFYSGSNETLQALSLLVHGDPPDTLGSSRIAIWKDALALGKEKPLLGGGPDTYNSRSSLTFTKVRQDTSVRRVSVDAAHNEYLNIWVNSGLPAMLLHLGLLGSVMLPAAKRLDGKRLALLLCVLGYSIYAFFGISQSLVTPIFYLMLGALARSGITPGQSA